MLGWVQPTETLMTLAEVGIILLLFEVGLDTNLFRLAEAGRKPFVVAAVGAFLPLVLGFAAGWLLFDTSILAALFIGGTLTATSIGITVRVLDDLMRRRSDEAQIVIGAAVIDDILGVIILAFLYDFSSPKGVSLASTASIALVACSGPDEQASRAVIDRFHAALNAGDWAAVDGLRGEAGGALHAVLAGRRTGARRTGFRIHLEEYFRSCADRTLERGGRLVAAA